MHRFANLLASSSSADARRPASSNVVRNQCPLAYILQEESGHTLHEFQLSEGWTAFHLAADVGHIVAIQRMLRLHGGLEVDRPTHCGMTPLHFGAKRGYGEVVKILLKAGCAVDPMTVYGNTPLMLAVRWGCVETICLLLEAGADTLLANNDGNTPFSIGLQKGASLNSQIKGWNTQSHRLFPLSSRNQIKAALLVALRLDQERRLDLPLIWDIFSFIHRPMAFFASNPPLVQGLFGAKVRTQLLWANAPPPPTKEKPTSFLTRLTSSSSSSSQAEDKRPPSGGGRRHRPNLATPSISSLSFLSSSSSSPADSFCPSPPSPVSPNPSPPMPSGGNFSPPGKQMRRSPCTSAANNKRSSLKRGGAQASPHGLSLPEMPGLLPTVIGWNIGSAFQSNRFGREYGSSPLPMSTPHDLSRRTRSISFGDPSQAANLPRVQSFHTGSGGSFHRKSDVEGPYAAARFGCPSSADGLVRSCSFSTYPSAVEVPLSSPVLNGARFRRRGSEAPPPPPKRTLMQSATMMIGENTPAAPPLEVAPPPSLPPKSRRLLSCPQPPFAGDSPMCSPVDAGPPVSVVTPAPSTVVTPAQSTAATPMASPIPTPTSTPKPSGKSLKEGWSDPIELDEVDTVTIASGSFQSDVPLDSFYGEVVISSGSMSSMLSSPRSFAVDVPQGLFSRSRSLTPSTVAPPESSSPRSLSRASSPKIGELLGLASLPPRSPRPNSQPSSAHTSTDTITPVSRCSSGIRNTRRRSVTNGEAAGYSALLASTSEFALSVGSPGSSPCDDQPEQPLASRRQSTGFAALSLGGVVTSNSNSQTPLSSRGKVRPNLETSYSQCPQCPQQQLTRQLSAATRQPSSLSSSPRSPPQGLTSPSAIRRMPATRAPSLLSGLVGMLRATQKPVEARPSPTPASGCQQCCFCTTGS